MSKDGGYVVPQVFVQTMVDTATSTGTIWRGFLRTPVKPLTRYQRMRAFIWDFRYRLAKVIYPPAYYGDDD